MLNSRVIKKNRIGTKTSKLIESSAVEKTLDDSPPNEVLT